MRIDAYQIFGSGCSESRLLEVLEANIRDLILLNLLLLIAYLRESQITRMFQISLGYTIAPVSLTIRKSLRLFNSSEEKRSQI